MVTIDATPPEGFPEQVIVAQERSFAARHPNAAYWIRGVTSDAVRAFRLPGAVGLADARRMARRLGFEPTHFTDPGDGRPWHF